MLEVSRKLWASVRRVFPIATVMEGEGFLVHRPFPTQALSELDPFLLLDEFGPVYFAPGKAKGTGAHPHKGFEILSYILKGGFEHEDSLGNRATLQEGDVQWMTAGRGIVHREQPIETVKKFGGLMHGFQVWVNLPASKKLLPPSYQEIRASEIPTYTDSESHCKVKVIIGSAFGIRSPIQTHVPIEYHHYVLAPNAQVEIPLMRTHTTFLYPISGRIAINESLQIVRGQLPVFSQDGDWVRIRNLEAKAESEFIFFSGKPLGEPIARYGPFVMNTAAELQQAFAEYQLGKMGYLE